MQFPKTNAMRMLDRAKIAYRTHVYGSGQFADGVTVAAEIGRPCEMVFKTLVARGSRGGVYVFVIPVAKELDLKAAARAVSEKSVFMVHVCEITGLTGYVKGGCSPVGMKKLYRTEVDRSAETLPKIIVSGGKIGLQVELSPDDLCSLIGAGYSDIAL